MIGHCVSILLSNDSGKKFPLFLKPVSMFEIISTAKEVQAAGKTVPLPSPDSVCLCSRHLS
jgi:hypothetical protein